MYGDTSSCLGIVFRLSIKVRPNKAAMGNRAFGYANSSFFIFANFHNKFNCAVIKALLLKINKITTKEVP
ncbi:MAG TPA: hypothetical protein DCS12_07705 [Clostridiales bacterium]|jgi:hypothetical protein|nr:hypothetical protein [Clostridiales bacterium]